MWTANKYFLEEQNMNGAKTFFTPLYIRGVSSEEAIEAVSPLLKIG